MRKFTPSEKSNGELAIRKMSKKAQDVYDNGDIAVYEYVDGDATCEAEKEAFDNGVDFFPGDLDVVRYAIKYCGDVTLGLTFDEAEEYLEGFAEEE